MLQVIWLCKHFHMLQALCDFMFFIFSGSFPFFVVILYLATSSIPVSCVCNPHVPLLRTKQEWFKFVDHEKLLREGLENDLVALADEAQELKLQTIQQVQIVR